MIKPIYLDYNGTTPHDPQEVFFTSGGTESNNHAIIGMARALKDKGKHLITSKIEHPAVLAVCQFLEGEGFETTYVDVDDFGSVSVDQIANAIRPETILISIMHANNEVGTIQPIEESTGPWMWLWRPCSD